MRTIMIEEPAKPPYFSNYRQAVLATLAFFDLFKQPLRLEEVECYLLQQPAERHPIAITLNETKKISSIEHYYALRDPEALLEIREKRLAISKKSWKKMNRYRWVFALTPYLRGVSVCNTLATDNADERSDIDLFIVTDSKRLFLSRLLLTFWLQILGVRRHGNKIAGRFCLSFFATEDHLNLESIQKGPYDIYLAFWLRTLQPIVGAHELHEKVVMANQTWTQKFFATSIKPDFKHWRKTHFLLRTLQWIPEKILNVVLGEWIEKKLAYWQLQRARAKQEKLDLSPDDSAIILNRHMLKFHNTDRREDIYREWKERLKTLI
jgi:hypothetical protein